MPKIQLLVIPEPKSGSMIIKPPIYVVREPYVIFSGGGDTDYLCGCCRVVLASQIRQGQIVSLILKCGKCHSFNTVRGTKL